MALILFASALMLGAALVSRLRVALYPFEAVALIVVLGLFCWTWLAFLAALLLPYALAIPIVVAGSAAALWFTRRTERTWRPLEGGRAGWILWGAATAVTALLFVPLFWTHSLLPDSTGAVYSASSTWADFGLHAAIISHLAQFDTMPMDLPVASGTSMTYPFLIDFLSSTYLREGWGLHLSLFVPGVLLVLAFGQLLMSFSLRLFAHVGTAVLGLALVLVLGSAAGLGLAIDDWQSTGLSLAGFLSDLPRDYTTLNAENASVANLVGHALLPQRAFLFGFGIGLTVLILLHTARETGNRRYLIIAGVLTGMLPMAHAHTFIVCGAVLTALAVEALVSTRRIPWGHVTAGGIALALAAPQLAWQQLANGNGSGGRFRFGWMVRDGQSIWAFWSANFGLMGIFFVALPFLLLRREWRHHLVWYLPLAAILVVTQLYAFQPFEFDNLKLLYYVYLMASLLGAFLIVAAVRASRWSLALVVPIVFVIAAPGLLSIIHEFQQRDQFASTSDVTLAAWVRGNTRPDAVFIGTDRPSQPVSTLAGRPIVLGYRGWLYSYNLPFDEREAAVTAALQGRVDDPVVRKFHPSYLLLATNEDSSWTVDRDALAVLPVAYQNGEWTVYELADAGAPGDAQAGQESR